MEKNKTTISIDEDVASDLFILKAKLRSIAKQPLTFTQEIKLIIDYFNQHIEFNSNQLESMVKAVLDEK